MLQEILQGARCDDLTAPNARTRSQVQDPIGTAHGVLIVFHHHEGIAPGTQLFQGIQQLMVVAGMKSDRGLIEHVQHSAEIGTQLGGQADALSFATTQSRHAAAQLQVTQPHFTQELQALANFRQDVAGNLGGPTHRPKSVKPSAGLLDGPSPHLLDRRLASQRFTQWQTNRTRHRIEAGSLARRAGFPGFGPTEPRLLDRIGIGPALHIGQMEQLTETAALQAPALAGVVAEVLGVQRRKRTSAFRATPFVRMNSQVSLAIECEEGVLAHFKGLLDVAKANLGGIACPKNTRHHFHIVLLETVEPEVLIRGNQPPVGPQFCIPPLAGPFRHLAVEALAVSNHRSQERQRPSPPRRVIQSDQ